MRLWYINGVSGSRDFGQIEEKEKKQLSNEFQISKCFCKVENSIDEHNHVFFYLHFSDSLFIFNPVLF